MKLYFARHTSAADIAPSDVQRPLTRQGEDEARIVGKALAGLGIRPTRVFSSPLLRARQTAALIAGETGFAGSVELIEELANGSSTPALLKALPAGGELVLVGHMPSLADHVAKLTKQAASDVAFGKGSVACVESGRLVWLKHLPEMRER